MKTEYFYKYVLIEIIGLQYIFNFFLFCIKTLYNKKYFISIGLKAC
jgi:hypothetical protein